MNTKRKCNYCNKQFPVNCAALIEFEHMGYCFKFERDFSECPACAEKNAKINFDKYGKKLVKSEREKVLVDWSYYRHETDDSTQRILTKILMQLGILAFKKSGNWMILGESLDLNPGFPGYHLYFTSEEQVRSFAKCYYGGTLYSWEIIHMDRIIPKKEALK